MKTLLLLRHAKSSWKDGSLADHDRPLNKRGRRDAPRMGRWLAEIDLVPGCIVTSTALRARTTAEEAAEASGFDGEIVETPDLYHASAEAILRVTRELPDPHGRAMLVGHNPGLEDAIDDLAGAYEIMPTAALARIDFDADGWRDVAPGMGRLVAIWRPKELSHEG
jgi:phosphohistidine phosphatase